MISSGMNIANTGIKLMKTTIHRFASVLIVLILVLMAIPAAAQEKSAASEGALGSGKWSAGFANVLFNAKSSNLPKLDRSFFLRYISYV